MVGPKAKKTLCCITALLIGLVLAEVGLRIAYAYREQIKFHLGIDVLVSKEYEVVDSGRYRHWRLKPGFSQTLEGGIEAAERKGQILRAKQLRDLLERRSELSKDTVVYPINQDGFKGPELDRLHIGTRILCLGDSCTFGSPIDEYSYSRTMERELRRAGRDVEVVNGGVQGYSPRNVLLRIEEFKALRPEITTIYIGWNELFGDGESYGLGGNRLYILKVIRSLYRRVSSTRQQQALRAYTKPKKPDRDAPEVERLEVYVPSFMNQVEQIVEEMQSVGSRVALVTLPGIYSMDEEPSEEALRKGHVPFFTDNPYVIAKMVERYNLSLRELARKRGLQVIDLEKWSKTALQPRDAFFFDSEHLYGEGQMKIGEHMARELTPVLEEIEVD